MDDIVSRSEIERRKQKGVATEDRFYELMRGSNRTFPSWYYDVRRATVHEDRHGVDFIAELDVMEVELQIKSSKAGRDEHLLRQYDLHLSRTRNIPVIVVNHLMSDHIVKMQTLRVLCNERERFYRSTDRFDRRVRR